MIVPTTQKSSPDQSIETGLLSKFGSRTDEEGRPLEGHLPLPMGIARLILSYHPAPSFVDLFHEFYRTQLYQELYSVCKNDPLISGIKLQFKWPVLLMDNGESPELTRQRLASLQQSQVVRINKFLNTRFKRLPEEDRTISLEEFDLLTFQEKLNKFIDLYPLYEIRYVNNLNQQHPNNPNNFQSSNFMRTQRLAFISYLFAKKTATLIAERCAKIVNEALAPLQPPLPNPAPANPPQPQVNMPLRQRIFIVLKQFAFYFVVTLIAGAAAFIFGFGLGSLASRGLTWLRSRA